MIAACIPTIDRSPHRAELERVLLDDSVAVRLYINDQSAYDGGFIADERAEVIDRFGSSIYEEWNHAAAWAQFESRRYLLLLNDDIVMLPGTAAALANAMEENPGYGIISVGEEVPSVQPRSVYEVSHHWGNRRAFQQWCFIARVDMWQEVDPRFRIWWGDDDLIWKMSAAGHQIGVLPGVGVAHYTSTTSSQLAWVGQAAGEDSALWAQEHP